MCHELIHKASILRLRLVLGNHIDAVANRRAYDGYRGLKVHRTLYVYLGYETCICGRDWSVKNRESERILVAEEENEKERSWCDKTNVKRSKCEPATQPEDRRRTDEEDQDTVVF